MVALSNVEIDCGLSHFTKRQYLPSRVEEALEDEEPEQECPKCSGYNCYAHSEIIANDAIQEEEKYWAGVLAEKNETRHI